jgi:hypothetical protein
VNNTVKQIGMVILGFILLMFLIGTLSSDSGSSTATDTTTITEPAPVETYVPPTYTPEEQYLIDIHGVGDYTIDAQSDASLVELGHNVCDALDSGTTVTGLVQYLANSGAIDGIGETAGVLIGASIRDLCPEYTGQMNDFIDLYGS